MSSWECCVGWDLLGAVVYTALYDVIRLDQTLGVKLLEPTPSADPIALKFSPGLFFSR